MINKLSPNLKTLFHVNNLKNPLVIIVIIATVVRLWGIRWGFPYILDPDEPALIRSSIGFIFGDWNPHHFDWPTLHMYLSFFIFEIFIKFRAIINFLHLQNILEPYVPIFWDDPLIFYFLGRLISVVMGVASVALVYLTSKLLKFSNKVAFLTAIFMALIPIHVAGSQMALIDVPMVFWLSLVIYLSIKSVIAKDFRYLVYAALFVGFATSTKYNAALSVLIVLSAFVYHLEGIPQFKKIKNLLLLGIVTIGGFLVGTPYALLDHETFFSNSNSQGALWQLTRSANSENLGLWQNLINRIGFDLTSGMGYALVVASILGFYATFKAKSPLKILLPFTLAYLMVIVKMGYYQPHFLLPLSLPLILMAGFGIYHFRSTRFTIYLIGIILFELIFRTGWSMFILAHPDTRIVATNYINSNIQDGAVIAEGQAYEPILRPKKDEFDESHGYKLLKIDKYTKGKKYNEKSVENLKHDSVEYLLIGDFGLGWQFDEADNEGPTLDQTTWVKRYSDVVYRIDPKNQPGPTIILSRLK